MNLIYHFINARNTQVIPAGTVLFHEGDPAGPMYVLLSGALRITVEGQVVELASAGALVGEIALIDERPRSASVVAVVKSRVVPVGKKEFDLLVRERPQFARHVMKIMADRLRRMNAAYTGLSSAQRDAAALLRRAARLDDTVPI